MSNWKDSFWHSGSQLRLDEENGSVSWALIKQIQQECGRKGCQTEQELAAFVLKTVFQDPQNGYSKSTALTKNEVNLLIHQCVNKILFDFGPIMETIRMQVKFHGQYCSWSEIISRHHKSVDVKLAPLTREIVENQAVGRQALDALYSKVVTACVLRSGLGSPTHGQVLREASAALHSVFPASEFVRFLQMNKADKKSFLQDLSHIVAGIRLFNWSESLSGAGVQDLPHILRVALEAMNTKLSSLSSYTSKKASQMTGTMEQILFSPTAQLVIPEEHKQLIKSGLINLRQFQCYLVRIMEDLQKVGCRLADLNKELPQRLSVIRSSTSGQLAVPCLSIYPLFQSLASTWRRYQDEVVVLSSLSSLLKDLYNHTRCLADLPSIKHLPRLTSGRRSIVISEEASSPPLSARQIATTSMCNLVAEADLPQDSCLFASGFCPVALVTGHGFLLPGNPKLGYLQFEGHFFCLSSWDRAQLFCSDPKPLLLDLERLLSECPHLIRLLHLNEHFAREMLNPTSARPETSESGCQTVLHPVERHVDEQYSWNEWDLRRNALMLSSLRHKATHSAQTEVGFGLADAATQSSLCQATQTTNDVASG